MTSDRTRDEILFQYCVALRTNRQTDDQILEALQELRIESEEAKHVVTTLDASGITADSNNTPTAIGCFSMIIAVVATLATAMYLVTLMRPLVIRIVIIVISVGIGFGIHVAICWFLEWLGIATTRHTPMDIPNKAEVLADLNEA